MTTHILSPKEAFKRLEEGQIEIPFKDRFDISMEEGIKIRTWRTRRYGGPGNWFERKNRHYVLVKVERACMGSIPVYWHEEGFISPQDAIDTLKEIFPTNGYQPDRMGWAHWFKRIDGRASEVSGD